MVLEGMFHAINLNSLKLLNFLNYFTSKYLIIGRRIMVLVEMFPVIKLRNIFAYKFKFQTIALANSKFWCHSMRMGCPLHMKKLPERLLTVWKGGISEHALIYSDLLLYSELYLLRFFPAHIFLVRCLGLVSFMSIFFYHCMAMRFAFLGFSICLDWIIMVGDFSWFIFSLVCFCPFCLHCLLRILFSCSLYSRR